MITVTGRLVARVVMGLAGAALIALGVTAATANRVTGHEILAGLIALAVAAIAGLWLRRDKRLHDGGQS